MMQILINAYAVNPDWGSEPGMGWNWVIHLAMHCKVHVITEGEWRENIERELARLPQAGNIVFHYLPVPEKVRRMCWNQGDWRFYYHYRKWQKRALCLARQIMKDNRIDLIHQLNMIGFREPGLLWKIKGVPYVWGPVGGMENVPAAYARCAGWRQRLFVRVKNALNSFQSRWQPHVRRAVARSSVLVAAVEGVKNRMEEVYGKQAVVINETGCRPNLSGGRLLDKKEEFSLLWVGKADFRKQLHLAVSTLALLKDCEGLRLHICGVKSSEEGGRFIKQAENLGVSHMCIWHGIVPNAEILSMMRQSDLFFFTSIMEATSTVIAESLMARLPVLCFDTCGMSTVIDDSVGCKIPLSNPGRSARDFAERIRFFFHHRQVLREMDGAFLARQGELDWNCKAERMAGIYREVLKACQH
ncbi:glycosyltransferase family 4 protein [Akkermansia sp.]|uniref:glycosyltransferase family 4 protein n=1 Tax=Akkermansia sp. TaxID=1872421 RepID=UPI003A879A49